MWKWGIFIFFSLPAFSAPQYLEVWFLSNSKKAEVMRMLQAPHYVFHQKTAALQCQEMGDYCFDPQYGLYKKDNIEINVNIGSAIKDEGPSIPSGKSLDRNLIDCEKGNHFDIFCGQAKKEVGTPDIKFELWVDTSSSMREFDYSDKEGGCFRKGLVNRLDEFCPFNQKVNVMMFDTSIKQAGSIESLCSNQGLNDLKRLMDWIERSEAKKLVVITDIYELHKDFADFIDKKNGKIRGDQDPLTAEQMLTLVDELAKSCK